MENFAKYHLNMIAGAPVTNWWTNGDNQISFSRGNRAFIAINKAGYTLNRYFNTGMPEGSYCDVISSDMVDNQCTGIFAFEQDI